MVSVVGAKSVQTNTSKINMPMTRNTEKSKTQLAVDGTKATIKMTQNTEKRKNR